ncbi:uncharacterized protein LOC110027689 isoform X1 [Phalaenopsis equestris]|uniref:uncharacterized protein LOC110027689 isoform X1 n=1 Tax=Phalaenopsis equestris TaxID=78828 RepID=UPI0009E2DD4A|nr:uncharacterized protein LOC110027689 isoform X1 [Phalaenopsis equestris]
MVFFLHTILPYFSFSVTLYNRSRPLLQNLSACNTLSIWTNQSRGSEKKGRMNFVSRKIYLYNVTIGLYGLDPWERYLFNIFSILLLLFICYVGTRWATELYSSHIKPNLMIGGNFGPAANISY